MKQRSKALLVILSAAAMITAATFGTLAYFTDTKTVTNTFTVGKVKITLTESALNTDGTINTGADRVTGNTYNLIPGKQYVKDPILYIDGESEDCWAFVTVDNQLAAIEDDEYTDIEDQMAANGWAKLGDSYKVGNLAVWAYNSKITKGATDKNLEIFANFKVDGNKVINVEAGKEPTGDFEDIKEYADKKIIVTGYAIQAEGFDTAAAAWTAANGQFPTP